MTPSPPVPPESADKSEWRRWARTLPPVPPDTSRLVVEHLAHFLASFDAPVLTYVALADEVDIERIGSPSVLTAAVALPRLGDQAAMTVHLDDGGRERHVVGVLQPTAAAPVIDPAALGAVLVPGRVFDRDGFRLGRGGGHYDRLLPRVDPTVPVIGVTCTNRLVERVPRAAHDVPMTHLATEDGVFSTK